MNMIQKHPFHLVDPSPWPIVSATACGTTAMGAAMYMHTFKYGEMMLLMGLMSMMSCMMMWWRDMMSESTFNGFHTKIVQWGLRSGMILFILSEVMFFLAFFWAFFHSSLSPAIEMGSMWPPINITPFNPWGMPLLNTLILLLSGATITWAHHAMMANNNMSAKMGLMLTIMLALMFTSLQVFEYIEATFTMSDGIYGSTFYMATGFHGFHVMMGTMFLIMCYLRLMKSHFTKLHHFGFEAAAWYWHFVDVVWLFLFVNMYWWGNSI